MGNGLSIWQTASLIGNWLRDFGKGLKYLWNGLDNMGHGLSIWGTAEVCCKWLEYLKYGFDLW